MAMVRTTMMMMASTAVALTTTSNTSSVVYFPPPPPPPPSTSGGAIKMNRLLASTIITTTTTTRRPPSTVRCCASGAGAGLSSEMRSSLDKVVGSSKVVVFMKGTKDFPQCGFSNTVVQILKSLNVPFETINILENDTLRQGLKLYSSWPTFPQLYIDGHFFGGCDITLEAYQSGELQELLEKAMCS